MKTFQLPEDEQRLYFRNFDRKSDDEEFENIIRILRNANCWLGEPTMGPDADLIPGRILDGKFSVVRTIDGDGTFIYSEEKTTINLLREIFEFND